MGCILGVALSGLIWSIVSILAFCTLIKTIYNGTDNSVEVYKELSVFIVSALLAYSCLFVIC